MKKARAARSWTPLICGLAIAFCSWPTAADKLFTKQGDFSAFLSDDFTCSERVRLTLDAETDNAFQSDRAGLEKIVEGVRAALGFRCEGIKDILVKGTVKGQITFAAVSSEGTSWTLIDVPLDMVQGSEPTTTQAPPPPVPATEAEKAPEVANLPPPPSRDNEDHDAEALIPEAPVPDGEHPSTGEPGRGIEQFKKLKENVETGSFPIDGYKFPGLMTALYLGRMQDIPDDQNIRSLIGSVLRALSESCGEPPVRVAAMLPQYISPKVRTMQRDPMQGFGEILMGLAKLRDRTLETRDFGSAMADFAEEYAAFSTEGMADGRIFVARHGCPSREYDQISSTLHDIILRFATAEPGPGDRLALSRLMSATYRAQNNIPDPAVELARRKRAKDQEDTRKSCDAQFSNAQFCDCAVDKMAAANASDEVWRYASGTFSDVTKFSHLRPVIAQCY